MPPVTSIAFVMHGSRAAMTNGLSHIEEQITSIEFAITENPGLAFDLARTLVESTCRTILTDKKQSHSPNDDLPKLFKAVTTSLPFLPSSVSADGAKKSLLQTINGLHTALMGVCELRNGFGFASHGSDGSRPAMETTQAMLAAQAADAIVAFLHATHRQNQRSTGKARLRYEDNEEFNEYVDAQYEAIQIFDLKYPPSEVLFQVDQEAYRNALAEFVSSSTQEAEPGTSAGGGGGVT